MLDLAGRRAVDISRAYLDAVAGKYDRTGVTESSVRLVKHGGREET